MKTHPARKTLGLGVALLALAALPPAAAWSQIMGDLPTLAPEVAFPVLTPQSVLRIAGTWTCLAPEAACAMGTAPVIEGRLQMVEKDTQVVEKDTQIVVIPDKANPGRYFVRATLSLLGFPDSIGSGVLNLVITDDGTGGQRRARGAWVLAVMVEDKSATPAFPPYLARLAEPRPDPIVRFAPLF